MLFAHIPAPATAAASDISCPAQTYRIQRIIPDLRGPNGLLLADDHTVYVSEKDAGRVTRISLQGERDTIIDGLNHPDALAFDTHGRILVVEDAEHGDLVRANTDGTEKTWLISNQLDWPEGIVVTDNNAVIITESTNDDAQHVAPATRVSRWFDETGTLQQLDVISGKPMQYSYSGLALHSSGVVFATNELAGDAIDKGIASLQITANTPPARDNVDVRVFSTPLKNPKGLHFSHDGDFPLLIADSGNGRVAMRTRSGETTTVCTGFHGVEDVIEASDGRLYVSERGPDPDGAGRIVVLAPQQPPQPGGMSQRIFLPLLTN